MKAPEKRQSPPRPQSRRSYVKPQVLDEEVFERFALSGASGVVCTSDNSCTGPGQTPSVMP